MNGCLQNPGPPTGTLLHNALKESSMARSRKEHAPPRRRRRRQHGRRDESLETSAAHDPSLLEDLDESLLEPEERAYVEARRAAEEKVQLWSKVWKLAIVVVPLTIFVPWIAWIVLFFGGIDLARKAYRILYEPKLRERESTCSESRTACSRTAASSSPRACSTTSDPSWPSPSRVQSAWMRYSGLLAVPTRSRKEETTDSSCRSSSRRWAVIRHHMLEWVSASTSCSEAAL